MEIEFDPEKGAENRRNHGVSLALGRVVLAERAGEHHPAEGEVRIRAFGLVEGRFFACTYTLRGRVRRVISVHRVKERRLRKWLAST